MIAHVSALERAFQLARSGKCLSVAEIRRTLAAEGYSVEQVTGPVLYRQLYQSMEEAVGITLVKWGAGSGKKELNSAMPGRSAPSPERSRGGHADRR